MFTMDMQQLAEDMNSLKTSGPHPRGAMVPRVHFTSETGNLTAYSLGKLVEIDLLKENEILRPVTCEYVNAESSDVHVMGAEGLNGSDGPTGSCHRNIF